MVACLLVGHLGIKAVSDILLWITIQILKSYTHVCVQTLSTVNRCQSQKSFDPKSCDGLSPLMLRAHSYKNSVLQALACPSKSGAPPQHPTGYREKPIPANQKSGVSTAVRWDSGRSSGAIRSVSSSCS
jgi:hypothetical protein